MLKLASLLGLFLASHAHARPDVIKSVTFQMMTCYFEDLPYNPVSIFKTIRLLSDGRETLELNPAQNRIRNDGTTAVFLALSMCN